MQGGRPAGRHEPRRAQRRANEVCVEAFVAGRLAFPAIVDTVAEIVGENPFRERATLADVLESEEWARNRAHELVAGTTKGQTA